MSAGNRHSYKAGSGSLIRVFGFPVAENVTKPPRLKQMLEAPQRNLRVFWLRYLAQVEDKSSQTAVLDGRKKRTGGQRGRMLERVR